MTTKHPSRYAICATLAIVLTSVSAGAQAPVPTQTAPAATVAPTASAKASADKAQDRRSEISDILEKLDYPELQVVPRASQRLKMEAEVEDYAWPYMHWPVQASGLSTLFVATQIQGNLMEGASEGQKKDASTISTIAQSVGFGWIAGGVLIGFQRPYRSGMRDLARFNEKTESAQLLRERLAEESLERPARLMATLKWASVITNFGLSALMGAYMNDNGRIIAGVSATLAFLPVVFEDRSVEVYEKHIEYKKKIYGPLTGPALMKDPSTQRLLPGLQASWSF